MWRCARCAEEIEETYDACWKCLTPRQDPSDDKPADPVEARRADQHDDSVGEPVVTVSAPISRMKKDVILVVLMTFVATLLYVRHETREFAPTYEPPSAYDISEPVQEPVQEPVREPVSLGASDPEFDVSAMEWYKQFDNNLMAFEEQYRNRVIRLTGVVSGVDRWEGLMVGMHLPLGSREPEADRIVLHFQGTPWSLPGIAGISCLMAPGEEGAVLRVSRGEQHTVTGRVFGRSEGNESLVILQDCRF